MINRKMPFMKNIIGFLYNSMKIDEETIDYMYLNYANNNSEVMRNNLTQLVTNKFGRKYVQPYWAIVDNMKNVKNITWGNFLTGDNLKKPQLIFKNDSTDNSQGINGVLNAIQNLNLRFRTEIRILK